MPYDETIYIYIYIYIYIISEKTYTGNANTGGFLGKTHRDISLGSIVLTAAMFANYVNQHIFRKMPVEILQGKGFTRFRFE